jgi:hypothetical protein
MLRYIPLGGISTLRITQCNNNVVFRNLASYADRNAAIGGVAGLMDWSGSEPPTNEAIAGCGVLAQGMTHVAAIRDIGSLIIGQRDLQLDEITGLREVSHRGAGTVWLYEGGLRLRPATAEESHILPVMSVWGRRVIQVLAEKHFARD